MKYKGKMIRSKFIDGDIYLDIEDISEILSLNLTYYVNEYIILHHTDRQVCSEFNLAPVKELLKVIEDKDFIEWMKAINTPQFEEDLKKATS